MNTSKLRAAILIISETASQDPSSDKCTTILQDVFETVGNDQWEVSVTQIIPDDILEIQRFVTRWTDGEDSVNLIISSGGTGFALKDSTPEVKLLCLLTFKSNMTNSRAKRLCCLLYTDMHQG
jgi:gephyrin